MPRKQQEAHEPEDVGAATRRSTRAKGPLADADPNAGSPEKSGRATRKRGRADGDQAASDQPQEAPVEPAPSPTAVRRQQRQRRKEQQEKEEQPASTGTVGDAPGAAAAAAAAGNADEVEAQQPEVIGEVQPQRPAAAAAAGGSGGAGSSRIAGLEVWQLEGQRRADMDALAQAQRTSNTMELTYRMELPPELADLAAHGPAEGLVEVPATADVPMLKRFFMYGSHNKLKPPLQELVTAGGEVMVDYKEDGRTVMPLSRYGITSGSVITLRVVIPETLGAGAGMAAAPETAAYGGPARPSRSRAGSNRKRWTLDEIDALLDGIEAYGFGAWKSVTRDVRLLGSKNNVQCKDKWRNLELAVTRNLPMRGLVLTEERRERVLELAAKEAALSAAPPQGGEGDDAGGLAAEDADGIEELEDEEQQLPEEVQ